jgi:hypothetical protein
VVQTSLHASPLTRKPNCGRNWAFSMTPIRVVIRRLFFLWGLRGLRRLRRLLSYGKRGACRLLLAQLLLRLIFHHLGLVMPGAVRKREGHASHHHENGHEESRHKFHACHPLCDVTLTAEHQRWVRFIPPMATLTKGSPKSQATFLLQALALTALVLVTFVADRSDDGLL